MPANIFNLSQTFADTGAVPTTTPSYIAKQADHVVQGVVTAGPNSDPSTSVVVSVQVDRGDGAGFLDVGGVSGGFGLTPSTRGGPANTPVTISATTYFGLLPGWKVRGSVAVIGTPVAVSFAGNVT